LKNIYTFYNLDDIFEGMTTPIYMSPETIKKSRSTTKVDMWAIGIILYQLLSKGNRPFEESNYFDMMKAI
jgi:serine/threonine protein kinase